MSSLRVLLRFSFQLCVVHAFVLFVINSVRLHHLKLVHNVVLKILSLCQLPVVSELLNSTQGKHFFLLSKLAVLPHCI